jgi:hypothetical protein
MVVRKRPVVPAKYYSILIIYCLIILCAAAFSLKKPAYNWDILPYMGVILSYEKADAKAIHSEVYAIAKSQVPALYYNRMVDPSNTYRNSVAQSPEVFHSQIPFYIVKPLYTGAAYLLYKAGIKLPMATIWPSAIAYFLTGLLLFYWLKRYWSDLYACMAGLLVMLSPPLLTVAGLSSPDALSGFLLFTAVFFLTEKRSATTAFVFLLLAVFARIDNIIPAVFFLSIVFFANKGNYKMPAGKMVLLFAILFLAYFAVSANTSSFGWGLCYYPAFVKQLNSSYTANSAFDFKGYLALVKSQLITGLYFSFVTLFFFLVLLLLWSGAARGFSSLTIEQMLAVIFVVIMVVRFILQPLITDRLYIPYYLSVISFLVKKSSVAINQQQ